MIRRSLAALAVLCWAADAQAQSTFITPQPGVSVPGVVDMCATAAGNYVPCGSAGALARPVTLQNTPNVVPQQPQVVTGIGAGTTGAVTATLAAVPGKTVYLCGFDVSGIGGTAALGPVTVTGLLGGTFTYQLSSTAAGVTLSRTFTPCIPAANVTQAIAVVTTADGTASAVDVNLFGVAQ